MDGSTMTKKHKSFKKFSSRSVNCKRPARTGVASVIIISIFKPWKT